MQYTSPFYQHSAHLPPSFCSFGLALWSWGPMLVIVVTLKWLSKKYISVYKKFKCDITGLCLWNASVFPNFILKVFGTDFSSHHAFACLQACFLCFRSVQAAGGKSRSIQGRQYVSNTWKVASCLRQYTVLTNLDAWVPGKACTTSYVHAYDLKAQIKCMFESLF